MANYNTDEFINRNHSTAKEPDYTETFDIYFTYDDEQSCDVLDAGKNDPQTLYKKIAAAYKTGYDIIVRLNYDYQSETEKLAYVTNVRGVSKSHSEEDGVVADALSVAGNLFQTDGSAIPVTVCITDGHIFAVYNEQPCELPPENDAEGEQG